MSALARAWTHADRVSTAMAHREPDRVPVAMSLGLHAGKLLGLTIPEVFSSAANVVEGTMRLHERFPTDIIGGTWYAPIEMEAWGSESLFFEEGPPNAGAPVIRDIEAIARLEPPRIEDSWRMVAMLEAQAELHRRLGPDVPIMGGIVSPFSLPVMQLGFERYLLVLLERRDLWSRLMAVNEAWSLAWARAQVAAGVTALAYYDPVSSATIIPPALYAETGYQVAVRTIAAVGAPMATILASGRALPTLPQMLETGTAAVGPSCTDDLAEVKRLTRGRATIVGTLNGLAMRHWSQAETAAAVREVIRVAGSGGGLIVSDNHGEIPFQVPLDTIGAVVEATHTFGRYPLEDGDA